MSRPATTPRHASDPDYPDLHSLIAEHGSYAAITDEAWRYFDRSVQQWNRTYRQGLQRQAKGAA